LNPRDGVVGRSTENKMSQNQTVPKGGIPAHKMPFAPPFGTHCLTACFCESLTTTFQKHIQTFCFQSSDIPHSPQDSILLNYWQCSLIRGLENRSADQISSADSTDPSLSSHMLRTYSLAVLCLCHHHHHQWKC